MTPVTPRPITDADFADFGVVFLRPETPPMAADQTFEFWSDVANFHIQGETEIGLCRVFRQEGRPVTWMERHERTPELLIPIDAPFILPVMRKYAAAGRDGQGSIEAFQVGIGEAVVIGRDVWHSACHPVDTDEATYFVIFRRGTPAEDVIKTDVLDVSLSETRSA